MMKHVQLTAPLAETQLLRLSIFASTACDGNTEGHIFCLRSGRVAAGADAGPVLPAPRQLTQTGRAWPGAARLLTLACARNKSLNYLQCDQLAWCEARWTKSRFNCTNSYFMCISFFLYFFKCTDICEYSYIFNHYY